MLKIQTTDGQTVSVDLNDPAQAREWLSRLERDSFQAEISGVSVVSTHEMRVRCDSCGAKPTGQATFQLSLSRPEGLSSVRYEVERVPPKGKVKGGERVTLFAGDVRLVMMAHKDHPSARIILNKQGHRRFVPKQHRE